ncbi:MAG: hypothetical protein AB7F31_04975 [Parachlamydiales bacterium]
MNARPSAVLTLATFVLGFATCAFAFRTEENSERIDELRAEAREHGTEMWSYYGDALQDFITGHPIDGARNLYRGWREGEEAEEARFEANVMEYTPEDWTYDRHHAWRCRLKTEEERDYD